MNSMSLMLKSVLRTKIQFNLTLLVKRNLRGYQKTVKKSRRRKENRMNLKNEIANAKVILWKAKKSEKASIRYVILEGKLLIEEAFKAQQKFSSECLTLKKFYYLRNDLNSAFLQNVQKLFCGPNFGNKIIEVDSHFIRKFSNVTTSQGLMAVFNLNRKNLHSYLEKTTQDSMNLPFTLLLDNVRDPGNMGTIIRTAAAIGFNSILMTKGCVSPWSTKVLRSAMGAHFYIKIFNDLTESECENFLARSNYVFLADNKDNMSIANSSTDKIVAKRTFLDTSNLENELASKSDKPKHVTLIIGNESRGISSMMREIAFQKNGKENKKFVSYIRIPLSNNIESLNCAIAFAILGYDLRRFIINS